MVFARTLYSFENPVSFYRVLIMVWGLYGTFVPRSYHLPHYQKYPTMFLFKSVRYPTLA